MKTWCSNPFLGEQVLDALDLFGQSEAIRHVWEERGFRAAALDIQFGDDHDILSRAGFFNWLSHLLKMRLSCFFL